MPDVPTVDVDTVDVDDDIDDNTSAHTQSDDNMDPLESMQDDEAEVVSVLGFMNTSSEDGSFPLMGWCW